MESIQDIPDAVKPLTDHLPQTIRKDSDRYKVAKCIQAEPVFCGFGRSAHSKVISVSVLSSRDTTFGVTTDIQRWSAPS